MSYLPPSLDVLPRRRLLLSAGAALAAAAWAPSALAGPRADSRGRYLLDGAFVAPTGSVVLVPWTRIAFQAGSDFVLQPDGKVLINTSGLYETTLSIDWDLKANRDIALRQTGVRCQRKGQPDGPPSTHDRIVYGDMPGASSPETARFQGAWSPPDIALGAVQTIDVAVSPAGVVHPGDAALASHTSIRGDAMPADALSALVITAKVIDLDMVRVSLYNPTVAAGIHIPPGTLNVVAMSAQRTAGGSGDGWHPLHSPSVWLEAGDKVYATVRHHVTGSMVQGSQMSYLQIDRLE